MSRMRQLACLWIVLAGLNPAAAMAACVLVPDPTALQPLDLSRLVHKAPNGGAIVGVTGCSIGSGSTVSFNRDTVCEGDTIMVDKQQCLVQSIQSTAVGQVGQHPQPPASRPAGQGVPDIVPLLRKP